MNKLCRPAKLPESPTLLYRVATFREAGLEAKWVKRLDKTLVIVVRDPSAKLVHQRTQWWEVDAAMFHNMKADGVKLAFGMQTLVADVFSVPV